MSATAYEVIALTNTLVSALVEYGISFQELAQRQRQAEMEGREFGIEDLKAMREDAQKALDGLGSLLGEV